MSTNHQAELDRTAARERSCVARSGKTCTRINTEAGFTVGVPWDLCDDCFAKIPASGDAASLRTQFVQLTYSNIRYNTGKKPYPSSIIERAWGNNPPPSAIADNEAASAGKRRWDAVSHTWKQATSYAKSALSRGFTDRRVPLTIERTRHLSCFGQSPDGVQVQPPCPALSRREAGGHYCNECGCGERETALLDGPGYPKLAYPYLECPRGRPGFSNATPLRTFFDRVVVLNLLRRPDRLHAFNDSLSGVQWPFEPPRVVRALDGSKLLPPTGWNDGVGAYGCLSTHVRVLQDALQDEVKTLLVFEDDAEFGDDFVARVGDFLTRLPADWDIALLGGQHLRSPLPTQDPGILQAVYPNRTHAFAIRGEAIRTLCQHWSSWRPGQNGHADHMMAALSTTLKIYTPAEFFVAQRESLSDINGRVNPKRVWKEPPINYPLHLFLTRPTLIKDNDKYHFGKRILMDQYGGFDAGLEKIFQQPGRERKVQALRDWGRIIQMEAQEMGKEAGLWHPDAPSNIGVIHEAFPGVVTHE